MKRVLSAVLVILMLLSLIACGGSGGVIRQCGGYHCVCHRGSDRNNYKTSGASGI